MEHDRPRATPALIAQRLGLYLGVAALLALLITWGDTGTFVGGAAWSDVFWPRLAQLGMIAVILTMQRVGLLSGIVTGVVLAFTAVVAFEGEMASYYWIGEFFLHALKLIIVPLVVFAMIVGVTSLGDVRKLGRLGGRTVIYYVLTTLVAVVIGSVLVNIFRPGEGITLEGAGHAADKAAAGISDLVLSFVGCTGDPAKGGTCDTNIVDSMANLRMLPIIVFSLVFGAVLTTIGDKSKPVLAFCEGGNDAMMKVVHLIMLLAPVGVFGLVAGRFGTALAEHGTETFLHEIGALAGYSGTVLGGLAIHGVVVLPLILYFTTRRNVLRYVRGNGGVLLTAFSTASSAATIPLTLEAAEEVNGVDRRAAQFVIPLGATVNMNGTALYEAVAALFIAQAYGIELSFAAQLLVVVTATLAAIGAAGIPEAGLVTLVTVLHAVGLPTEGVGLILAIDWLLDRFRTSVNVWGDAVGAAVIERYGLGAPAPRPNDG
jgi:Na+/H+-dicarboxylate symporter